MANYKHTGWSLSNNNIPDPDVLKQLRSDMTVYACWGKPVTYGKVSEQGEILDSWAEINEAMGDGAYSDVYSVGNYKMVSYGSEGTIPMVIAGFDLDDLTQETRGLSLGEICGLQIKVDPSVSDSSDLSGVVVGVYKDEACSKLLGTVTTNEQGVSEPFIHPELYTLNTYAHYANIENETFVSFEDSSGALKNITDWGLTDADIKNLHNTISDYTFTETVYIKPQSVPSGINLPVEVTPVEMACILDPVQPFGNPEVSEPINRDSQLQGNTKRDRAWAYYFKPTAMNCDLDSSNQTIVLPMSANRTKAEISWVGGETLKTPKQYQLNNYVSNDFEKSIMNEHIKGTVWSLMEAEPKQYIQSVSKVTYVPGKDVIYNYQLWIPSLREIANYEDYEELESSGSVYSQLFNSDSSRIRYESGTTLARSWATRSSRWSSFYSSVWNNGEIDMTETELETYIVPGFCTSYVDPTTPPPAVS